MVIKLILILFIKLNIQKVVFKSQKPEIEDKNFDLNVLNSEIKKLNIEIL